MLVVIEGVGEGTAVDIGEEESRLWQVPGGALGVLGSMSDGVAGHSRQKTTGRRATAWQAATFAGWRDKDRTRTMLGLQGTPSARDRKKIPGQDTGCCVQK